MSFAASGKGLLPQIELALTALRVAAIIGTRILIIADFGTSTAYPTDTIIVNRTGIAVITRAGYISRGTIPGRGIADKARANISVVIIRASYLRPSLADSVDAAIRCCTSIAVTAGIIIVGLNITPLRTVGQINATFIRAGIAVIAGVCRIITGKTNPPFAVPWLLRPQGAGGEGKR